MLTGTLITAVGFLPIGLALLCAAYLLRPASPEAGALALCGFFLKAHIRLFQLAAPLF